MYYNYSDAVYYDVIRWINDNRATGEMPDFDDADEAAEFLTERLWTDDSVTGNASGSYFFNAYEAEEALCHNYDLLAEACREFCADLGEAVENGAEHCDVTIRCYVLGEAVSRCVDDLIEMGIVTA